MSRPKSIELTPRELEVYRFIVLQGLPKKDIAARLGIGAGTVDTFITRILKKRGVHTCLMLAVRHYYNGLQLCETQESASESSLARPEQLSLPLGHRYSYRYLVPLKDDRTPFTRRKKSVHGKVHTATKKVEPEPVVVVKAGKTREKKVTTDRAYVPVDLGRLQAFFKQRDLR